MTMTPHEDDPPDALDAAACLFRAFGDPSRLTILQHLALGEHRVVDLTAHLGLAQSTVSKHLACLRDCGLVTSRPEGRSSVFSLTHPDALTDLLAAAERLLALTGDAVTLCPTTGTAGDPAPADDRPPATTPVPTADETTAPVPGPTRTAGATPDIGEREVGGDPVRAGSTR